MLYLSWRLVTQRKQQTHVRLTGYGEFERVAWWGGCEGDFETIRRYEGFVKTSHDVDLRPLRQLLFTPYYRVVEEIIRLRPEGAIKLQRFANISHVELSVR